ncbi:hypothetical protein HMPREF2967_07160 [Corynebacterium sp. HMSC059E07]|nr:hypothetical protein HMPREF2967_07160 [Corynebacterium sp. HMSC059E07]
MVSSCEGRVKNARRGLQFADTLSGRHTELFWHTTETLQVDSWMIFHAKRFENQSHFSGYLFIFR